MCLYVFPKTKSSYISLWCGISFRDSFSWFDDHDDDAHHGGGNDEGNDNCLILPKGECLHKNRTNVQGDIYPVCVIECLCACVRKLTYKTLTKHEFSTTYYHQVCIWANFKVDYQISLLVLLKWNDDVCRTKCLKTLRML